MKNFIQAIVIIAVAMAVYNSRIPAWLQDQWSEDAASASHAGNTSTALTDNDGTVHDDALDSMDEAQMLEAFEQGYQPPGDCDMGQSATARCELHRQRRLEEFRRQWSAYYLR